MRTTLILVALACMVLPACKPEQRGPTPEEIAAEKVSQALRAGSGEGGAPAPQVAVAAEGSRFDPPVRVEQLPAGVWYCDLGTVHYARPDEGDGRCPVCGMTLSHR
jgi:hypothetical protein